MGNKLNLKDQRFGRLIVLKEMIERQNSHVYWLCRCDCGNIIKTKGVHLKSGHTQSCGCLQRENSGVKARHGHCINGIETKTYNAWAAMFRRCNNPYNASYKYYGGRGIKVCNRWLKFENFLADMGEAPKDLTLDRKDNDGDYEPGNCCWATREEQSQNNRQAKLNPLKIQVIKKLLKESKITQIDIAEIFKVARETICNINTGKIWKNIIYVVY